VRHWLGRARARSEEGALRKKNVVLDPFGSSRFVGFLYDVKEEKDKGRGRNGTKGSKIARMALQRLRRDS
jgi:hypothetical protein